MEGNKKRRAKLIENQRKTILKSINMTFPQAYSTLVEIDTPNTMNNDSAKIKACDGYYLQVSTTTMHTILYSETLKIFQFTMYDTFTSST